jgi:hypothetical protein
VKKCESDDDENENDEVSKRGKKGKVKSKMSLSRQFEQLRNEMSGLLDSHKRRRRNSVDDNEEDGGYGGYDSQSDDNVFFFKNRNSDGNSKRGKFDEDYSDSTPGIWVRQSPVAKPLRPRSLYRSEPLSRNAKPFVTWDVMKQPNRRGN